ncbi:MAG: uroporphyrinogen-III synthase [Candidatus Sericytochromatia bacterium]|nr:uroporphyrinogen-III synthase [Candidatus Sericytochromatia bacterium]
MINAEHKPLRHLQVGLTRPAAQSAELQRLLQQQGAEVQLFPTLEILPLNDLPAAASALAAAQCYDGLLLTSPNTVTCLARVAQSLQLDLAARFAQSQIAAVGSKTAQRAESLGLVVDTLPVRYDAESLADTLIQQGVAGRHYLLPCGRRARPVLSDMLQAAGARVTRLVLYDTVMPADFDLQGFVSRLQHQALNTLLFTSPSSVQHLQQLLSAYDADTLLQGVQLVSIGPVTSAALKDSFGRVDLEAPEATQEGLLQALLQQAVPA